MTRLTQIIVPGSYPIDPTYHMGEAHPSEYLRDLRLQHRRGEAGELGAAHRHEHPHDATMSVDTVTPVDTVTVTLLDTVTVTLVVACSTPSRTPTH